MTKKDTSTDKKGTGPLFNPGKAQWLRDKGKELDKDQQALLLAMANLEAKLGRELSEEEAEALEALAEHMNGFDPDGQKYSQKDRVFLVRYTALQCQLLHDKEGKKRKSELTADGELNTGIKMSKIFFISTFC